MKYAIIVLMLVASSCSKELGDDNLEVSMEQPLKRQADTILIPLDSKLHASGKP